MSRRIAELAQGGETREELLALIEPIEYTDGRTKQAFKDQCDINKMLAKAQQAGSISHLLKYPEAVYGEFDGEFSLLDAQERISRANEIFADLPSEVRNEFNNNPLAFVQFAGDPANNDKLDKLLPAIAEPGSYFPNPVQRGGQGAGAATAPLENPVADSTGNPPPSDTGSEPSAAVPPGGETPA